MKFFVVINLREAVPSAFARNKSSPSEYASILLSGDHAPDLPTVSPSLRGEPPRIGRLHSGVLVAEAWASNTRSCDPSGETASASMVAKEPGIGVGSPPEIDTSAMLR